MKRLLSTLLIPVLFAAGAACRSESAEPSAGAAIPARLPGAPPARPQLAADPVFDEMAGFLAGIPGETPVLKALQETEGYKEFSAALEKNWADVEAKRLLPMRGWAAAELADAETATTTLFYPFGGPDFLTSYVIFPNATTYVLQGLEFVGRLPVFDAAAGGHIAAYTQNLLASLSDFFNKSYFITRNMDAILTNDKVDGVLPLLAFFLKRTNNTIASIKRCELLDKGEVLESDFPGERTKFRRPYGLKVDFFANGTDRLRHLYYFSCDFVDGVFRPDTTFYQYLEKLPFESVFVKSASYLMHYKEFSAIRNLLLAKSRFLLQDDTGIPYRFFPEKDWTVQLYGEYITPVKDFSGVEQADLKSAYADPARVRALPFHLGYHWGTSKDSILYIRRKINERP